MAVSIDAKLIYMNDVNTAATVNGNVIDLGGNGVLASPMFCTVKLTKGLSAGTVAKVTVQSSANESFSSPVEEMSVTVGASVDQTKPCNLAQFFFPLEVHNRYTRVVVTGGSTAPSGGKLWAYLSPDFQAPV